jgi:hypothetical protein
MTRWLCAHRKRIPSGAAVLLCAAVGTLYAQVKTDSPRPTRVFEVVKRFDFNERPLGNYEDVPMYWQQLDGDGLPPYSRGRFDDGIGHAAPPSFRFDLQGGSIAYEYIHTDMTIQPGTDHMLAGYIRANGLEHSRAFVQAYLVDRFGQPIPDSDRVSRLVGPLQPPEADDDEPWQRVQILLNGDFAEAYALRVRFWLLQTHAWRRAATAVDPIVRQDVSGTVWFDDFVLHRLPHVALSLKDPTGLVRPGSDSALVVNVRTATPIALPGILRISDADRREVWRLEHEFRPHVASPLEQPLPNLPPGLYHAELWLKDGPETLPYRHIQFAVLPELPPKATPPPDFGADLERWRLGDLEGVFELLRELRCGAAKLPIPIVGDLDTDSKRTYFSLTRELTRRLLSERVRVTAVLLPPEEYSTDGQTVRQMLAAATPEQVELSPILAHLAGLTTSWQLGSEQDELAETHGWQAADLRRFRDRLHTFVAAPQLVMPRSILDPALTEIEPAHDAAGSFTPDEAHQVRSIFVPSEIPAWAFPHQLAFLATQSGPTERWLRLAAASPDLSPRDRATDLARRLVLARTLGADRVYVAAPLAQSSAGTGRPAWYPTAEYVPLRTLFHCVSGRDVAAVLPLAEHDALAVMFSDPDSACMIVWSWRDDTATDGVELYLGRRPTAINLWGRPIELEQRNGRTLVPLAPTPIILSDIDVPLALLQCSLRVEPQFIQLHEPDDQPVLQLHNPYDAPLSGTILLDLPELWQADPRRITFTLAPGETLRRRLNLKLPPREFAGTRQVRLQFELYAPVAHTLEFEVPLTVGLQDVQVRVRTEWDGSDLIVAQTLLNRSDLTVAFAAYCRVPQWPQAEGAFLNVGPGEEQTQRYVYQGAAALAGATLRVGIAEINGRRALDQLVEITPQRQNTAYGARRPEHGRQ